MTSVMANFGGGGVGNSNPFLHVLSFLPDLVRQQGVVPDEVDWDAGHRGHETTGWQQQNTIRQTFEISWLLNNSSSFTPGPFTLRHLTVAINPVS
jgi:hypothetical protein